MQYTVRESPRSLATGAQSSDEEALPCTTTRPGPLPVMVYPIFVPSIDSAEAVSKVTEDAAVTIFESKVPSGPIRLGLLRSVADDHCVMRSISRLDGDRIAGRLHDVLAVQRNREPG